MGIAGMALWFMLGILEGLVTHVSQLYLEWGFRGGSKVIKII